MVKRHPDHPANITENVPDSSLSCLNRAPGRYQVQGRQYRDCDLTMAKMKRRLQQIEVCIA